MDGLAVPAHGFKLLAGTGNRPLAEEIARQLGISQMHVSRIIRRSLTRLRSVAEAA